MSDKVYYPSLNVSLDNPYDSSPYVEVFEGFDYDRRKQFPIAIYEKSDFIEGGNLNIHAIAEQAAAENFVNKAQEAKK